MRILLASDLYFPVINGVSVFTRNLAHGLAARGHTVAIIAPSQSMNRDIEFEDEVTIYRTRAIIFPFYQNIRISLSPNIEVRRIIKDFQPDVVHIQMPLGIGQAAMSVADHYRIPIVSTSHAMPENLMDNLKRLSAFSRPINYMIREWGRHFHNKADTITSPTQSGLNSFGKHAQNLKKPVRIISNGINLAKFSPGTAESALYEKYRLPTDKPVLVYVGRLDAEKHIDIVLHAFARVRKDKDAHLLLIGSGLEEDNLKQSARDLGISQAVTFAGFVPEEDKIALEKTGHLFVIASPVELQCIAALEAMASGMPVVAVNAGALPELCQDGKNGYTFDLDDDQDAADKIVTILSDAAMWKKYSDGSLAIAKSHDLEHTLDEFEALYKEVIDCKVKLVGRKKRIILGKALPKTLRSKLTARKSTPTVES
jgi:glycosyltransferase involved in cell wall biosynthesis